MSRKVIISGGGTGGHIYPAIAIANALREAEPGIEILFVGAIGKMEMEKVPQAGYDIIGLPVVGFKRALSVDNLSFPVKLARSLLKANQIVRDFKPDVAVGVGGYASGPVLIMASLAGIPTLVQEQNSYAGVTNKFLSKRASVICVAYPGMEAFFSNEKIKLLGNPVRGDISEIAVTRENGLAHFGLDPGKKTLFVMGGSLGARSINRSIKAGLELLLAEGYQVLWQTGKSFIAEAHEAINVLETESVKAFEFIYEMDMAYAAADVVVSRAGALSVSELCLVAKPAILVPFPAAAEDHQTKNALNLVEQAAAILVSDARAQDDLVAVAMELLQNSVKQETLKTNIRKLAKPDAARNIAAEVRNLIS
jgi:UDP-N-acetylglucosamine--N-acetylmuramyl-(pentapeptide) pyrophosphoryl-undecaprenol N-acetylglucosamine transferase